METGDKVGVSRALNLKKAFIWGSISLLISGICLLLVLRFTQSQNVLGGILQVGVKTIALAAGLVVASWFSDGLRMSVLSRAMGGDIGIGDAMRISMMGSFMAGVTPFDTGGEPLKVYFLHRKGMSVGQATATVTLAAVFHATTRFFLWALLPLAGFLLGFSWQVGSGARLVLGFGVFVYLLFLSLLVTATVYPKSVSSVAQWVCDRKVLRKVLPPERLERAVRKISSAAYDFKTSLVAFKSKRNSAILAFLLSILYWAFVIAVPVFLLRKMGSGLSTMQIVSLSMTVYLVMAYVPTPGASGGAEVGSAICFSPFLSGRILGTFVVVWRLVTYYFTLAIGGGFIAAETISWSMRKTDFSSS